MLPAEEDTDALVEKQLLVRIEDIAAAIEELKGCGAAECIKIATLITVGF